MAPSSIIPATTPMATFVDVAIDEVVVVAAAVSTVGIECILTLTFAWLGALPAFRVTLFCVFNAFLAWCIFVLGSES
jgi:ABC-type Na+ efflux pump permease subunit